MLVMEQDARTQLASITLQQAVLPWQAALVLSEFCNSNIEIVVFTGVGCQDCEIMRMSLRPSEVLGAWQARQ
jgi:hypothetical protein